MAVTYDVESEPEDQIYKICVLGNSGVGKSSLVRRYCLNEFQEHGMSTIGCEMHVKRVRMGDPGVYCSFQFWDTAGQERFAKITNSYYRDAVGLVVVFSLSDAASLEAVEGWVEQFNLANKRDDDTEVPVLLIGNKNDVDNTEEKQRLIDQATQLAQDEDWSFMVTSARSGDRVYEAFSRYVKHVFQQLYSARKRITEDSIDEKLHRAAEVTNKLRSSARVVPTMDATGEHDGGVAMLDVSADPRKRTGSLILMAPSSIRASTQPSPLRRGSFVPSEGLRPPPLVKAPSGLRVLTRTTPTTEAEELGSRTPTPSPSKPKKKQYQEPLEPSITDQCCAVC